MKTKSNLEHEIVSITMKIHKEFPELSKYIAELPEQLINKDSTNLKTKKFKEYFKSLELVVSEYAKTHESKNTTLDGYPNYPVSEDIFNQDKEIRNLNPEDLSKNKSQNEKRRRNNEKDFEEDMSGDDLDVPGTELDDDQEEIGSEDEENNYYSLGGDDHNNLDENKE
jgi:hypothetical protein